MTIKDNISNNCGSEKRCQQIEVPTKDEIKALNAMRDIKDRVRELKKTLAKFSSTEGDGATDKIRELETEISRLKEKWKTWERKKEDAARERMILLGHKEV